MRQVTPLSQDLLLLFRHKVNDLLSQRVLLWLILRSKPKLIDILFVLSGNLFTGNNIGENFHGGVSGRQYQ